MSVSKMKESNFRCVTCVMVDQTNQPTNERTSKRKNEQPCERASASEQSKSQQFSLKSNSILEIRPVCIGLHIKTCIIHGWDYFSLHRISATLRKMYNNPISQMVSWFLAYSEGLAKQRKCVCVCVCVLCTHTDNDSAHKIRRTFQHESI